MAKPSVVGKLEKATYESRETITTLADDVKALEDGINAFDGSAVDAIRLVSSV